MEDNDTNDNVLLLATSIVVLHLGNYCCDIYKNDCHNTYNDRRI